MKPTRGERRYRVTTNQSERWHRRARDRRVNAHGLGPVGRGYSYSAMNRFYPVGPNDFMPPTAPALPTGKVNTPRGWDDFVKGQLACVEIASVVPVFHFPRWFNAKTIKVIQHN